VVLCAKFNKFYEKSRSFENYKQSSARRENFLKIAALALD